MSLAISGSTTVFLLAPAVEFERIQSVMTVPSSRSSRDDLAASLRSAARAAVAAAHVTSVDCQDAEGQAATVCTQLDALSGALARGSVKAGTRLTLQHLSEREPTCAVLATLLVAELGPGDYYNSVTGQMGSAMSKSVFSAALTRCDTGAVLWKNEVLLRAVPEVRDAGYLESLQLLFEGSKPPS